MKMSEKDSRPRCEHLKSGVSHLWCDACAERYADPKPKLMFKIGDFCAGFEGEPGRVMKVEVILYGIATPKPYWREVIHVRSVDGWWQGPVSDRVYKLVPIDAEAKGVSR